MWYNIDIIINFKREKEMSGGHFDYMQFKMKHECYEALEKLIQDNQTTNEYTPEVIKEFKKGLEYLGLSILYLHRIDWLVSGDDGEESFFKNLKSDIIENKF